MIFGFGILATALLLSIVAAYYSVAGLVAIFSAATIPVIIMGGSLELGKVVATVWLHNNWRRAGFAFKAYLIPAVAFLMLLTSMGIFGYLSKAHSDQSLISGDSMAKVAIYDEKIKTEKDNVDANRKALKQLDEAVDQVMGRSTDEKGADKAVAIRRGQQKERSRLLAEISESQKRITTLNEERAPLAIEFRKVEAEVGPIKYIAALVYGDNPDANILEKAVRLVIILIVMVFDPLALTLILAANKQFEWARQGKGGFVHDEPAYPEDEGPIDQAVLDQLRERVKEDLPQGPVVAKSSLFSDDPINCYKCGTALINAPGIGLFCPNKICDVVDGTLAEESILDKHPYLLKPFEHFENLKPMVYNPELEKMNDRSAVHDDDIPDEDTPEMKAAKSTWKSLNPTDTLKHQRSLFESGKISELPWMQYLKPAPNSSFGLKFPDAPARGDSFVRTDVAPNQLFKFNGDRWILVDKATADNYTYDTAYIDHLIDKINNGSYDVDLLSASEQEQVAQRLQTKTNNT
jgi:hypothetical protein